MGVTEGRHGFFLVTLDLGQGPLPCSKTGSGRGISGEDRWAQALLLIVLRTVFGAYFIFTENTSVCTSCLSLTLDTFLDALVLENVFCVDLSFPLCSCAFVHCDIPEPSRWRMVKTVESWADWRGWGAWGGASGPPSAANTVTLNKPLRGGSLRLHIRPWPPGSDCLG